MTENTSGADTSYEQALKSTGIVGGAQFLTILITVVKTKIVALLLGPAGVGVLGLLQGIVDMIRNATFNAWVPLLSAAVIYLCLTLGLSSLFARLERRLARSDRG